jgi:hypothetical protein
MYYVAICTATPKVYISVYTLFIISLWGAYCLPKKYCMILKKLDQVIEK